MSGNQEQQNQEDDDRTLKQKTKSCDVTFITGDEKIYASKSVLSIASPVFGEMFESKPTKEIRLTDIEETHFLEFLKYIYPDRQSDLSDTTVYWVLPLAHKYKVRHLKMKCEKLLSTIVRERHNKNATQLYRHIELSELYGLRDLENCCVAFASECSSQSLINAQKSHMISQETELLIFKTALGKSEVFKGDDDYCFQLLDKKFLSDTILGAINRLLDDRHYFNEWKIPNLFRALRLADVHFKDNKHLKRSAMEKIATLNKADKTFTETLTVLPEELKNELEKFYLCESYSFKFNANVKNALSLRSYENFMSQ